MLPHIEEEKLDYNLVLDVVHSRECLLSSIDKVKEIVGKVENIVVLERESY